MSFCHSVCPFCSVSVCLSLSILSILSCSGLSQCLNVAVSGGGQVAVNVTRELPG